MRKIRPAQLGPSAAKHFRQRNVRVNGPARNGSFSRSQNGSVLTSWAKWLSMGRSPAACLTRMLPAVRRSAERSSFLEPAAERPGTSAMVGIARACGAGRSARGRAHKTRLGRSQRREESRKKVRLRTTSITAMPQLRGTRFAKWLMLSFLRGCVERRSGWSSFQCLLMKPEFM